MLVEGMSISVCGAWRYTAAMLKKALFGKHLEEDEVLLRVVHKHWLVGLKALFWPTLFCAGLISILAFLPRRPIFLTVSMLSVAGLIWWVRNFLDYYLDAWLVTNEGIIDIEWFGWFHRQSTRVLYSDIQGVSYEIKGVMGTLLRFGLISVEKISTGATISLENVKNPRAVEGLILRSMETYLHSKNLKDSKQIQELLASLVAQQIQEQELAAQAAGGDDEEDAS